MTEASIPVLDERALRVVFGSCDRHLRTIRETLGVRVTFHDGRLYVEGTSENVARAAKVLEQLQESVRRRGELMDEDVQHALDAVGRGTEFCDVDPIEVYSGRQVRPRTAGQARYIETLKRKRLVFCTGPAGTGKTYLAVAMAASALRRELIRKIVLVRPAVEAGESLGYLPGDLQAKINPYLRPLFDALHDMMEHDMMRRYMAEDIIEVIPLAYMRGRTLSNAFIILDEAQNTTVSQMKMFLTRMGEGSTIVVCGDHTQVDLPRHARSGLIDALNRLDGIRGIGAIRLSGRDIVRHRIVQDIVNAYERDESHDSSANSRAEPAPDDVSLSPASEA